MTPSFVHSFMIASSTKAFTRLSQRNAYVGSLIMKMRDWRVQSLEDREIIPDRLFGGFRPGG
jgi:hypothetical protein